MNGVQRLSDLFGQMPGGGKRQKPGGEPPARIVTLQDQQIVLHQVRGDEERAFRAVERHALAGRHNAQVSSIPLP